jgi:muramoyltetrapeptide carboxypeptidase
LTDVRPRLLARLDLVKLLKPPALRPQAVVGVIAPASPVRREFVERGVAELERLGFRAKLGRHLYDKSRYTAGSVDDRLADLVELWDDPDVSALFCARGGYGAMELLGELGADRFRDNPKVFLGSSDVTALLGFMAARAGIVSFHGPMLAQQIARGSYDAEGLLAAIGSERAPGLIPADGVQRLHEGAAEGVLFGGCLSLIASLIGTPFLPSFEGSILFLEDIQVKPYQIDRMLTQLSLAGRLEGVRGLVFGQMPGCEQHPEQGYTLPQMLTDWTDHLNIPVLFGFPSGHTSSECRTLPLGVRARLDGDGLSVLEGAVR